MTQSGLWFDGVTAIERPVDVEPDQTGLALTGRSGERHIVHRDDLVRLYSTAGQVRLGHRTIEGWRLVLREPVDPEIRCLLPAGQGSVTPAIGRRKMGLFIGIAAVESSFAALVVFAPEVLARRMPMSWERKIGAGYDLPIAATRCSNPPGQAALDALIDRIDPKARKDGFTLELVSLNMANAVALPGGRMVIFNGLLPDVENTDAIAGIVAHEIAHVRRRHVASAMVREMGLSTVITTLGGGTVASNAGGLLSLKFSRGAEAEADSDAIAVLKAANVDPRPTGKLFEKFAREAHEDSGFNAEFLQTHPLSVGRARNFQASFDARRQYRPVLSPAQADDLRKACRSR